MNKKVILIHRIIYSINVVLLAASLVFFLIKWKELPAEIGIHFDSDGELNVTASKFYGFYPHIIGSVFLIGIAAADHLIGKRSSGLKISEKGEELFKCELLLTLDVFLFIPIIYMSHWAYCVAVQSALNLGFLGDVMGIGLLIICISVIIQIITCRKYKIRDKNAPDTKLFHRLSRLITWLVTVGGFGVIAECWERYPGDPDLYFDPEYENLAYFGNFDAYLDKRLLLIPHVLIVVILAVFEIISVKAGRKNNDRLVLLTDRLKLICGLFFFWWNISLESEQSVGIISVSLFAVLCALSAVRFAIAKNLSDEGMNEKIQ